MTAGYSIFKAWLDRKALELIQSDRHRLALLLLMGALVLMGVVALCLALYGLSTVKAGPV